MVEVSNNCRKFFSSFSDEVDKRMRGFFLLIALFSIPLFLPCSSAASEKKSPVGNKIENFTLKDYRGKTHSLQDYADQKILVVAFLGTECPLAKLYAPRLAELARDYQDKGVGFLGINANVQDNITEIAAYARKHKIEFPVLKDLGNKVADQMGAVRTPEVFVLDQDRIVRYWGRIDDQYGVDYVRDDPKRHDLQIALDELLAGKKVTLPVTQAPGCFIGRVREVNENSPVTYSRDIAPILNNRCVECHREGEIAPFSLTNYDEVVGWAETIDEVVREQRMPPWHANPKYGHFKNDRGLSEQEKKLIYQWVKNGAPEGNPDDLPPAPKFLKGWQSPRKPDRVIPITKKPFPVPARGTVKYQYFVVDPGFEEDKWFNFAEIRPGNRAVVHHILVFNAPEDNIKNAVRAVGGGRDSFLVGYVPGSRFEPFPEGMAKRIPAGHHLVFQVHYTPIGTPQEDQSVIAFNFVDPQSVKYEIVTCSASHQFMRVPPRDANRKVEKTTKPLREVELLAMMPHMHLRGKSFRYEAIYPNGKKEILLDVPHYDFNWQTAYRLSEKKKLPKGTRVHCVAHYDNSSDNLNNPNPNSHVYWGEQTWEEMMIGYFAVAMPVDPSRPKKIDPFLPVDPQKWAQENASDLVTQFDLNADKAITRFEVPFRLQFVFNRLDLNSDGQLTVPELTDVFMGKGRKK